MAITTYGGSDRANQPDVPEDATEADQDAYDLSAWSTEFDVDYGASQENRDQANEDVRFVMVPGGQWEGFLGDQFSTARPRMEMDKTYERVNVFMSQFAEAKPGINYAPASNSDTSEDDAKLLNGLYRADMRRKNGYYSLYNAVHEGTLGGIGALRLRPEFEDPDDDENMAQRIAFEPIHAAYSSVIWDANAKRYDKRDARRCHILTFLTTDAFMERFPGKSPASVQNNDRREFNWNSPGGAFVAEKYWIAEEVKTSVLLQHPQTGEKMVLFEEDMKEQIRELDESGFEEVRRRKKVVRMVKKAVYSGTDLLEGPIDVAGKYIPIVPFYAFWIYCDGQEQFHGLIRKQKDGQRLFNTQVSSLAELAASSIKEVPIFAPEQMNGPNLQEQWSQAHLGEFNYLLAKPLRNESGEVLHAGPTGASKPPTIPPALQGILQVTSEYVRDTGNAIPNEVPSREISGDALRQINKRVDLKTYLVMENVNNSLILAGDIYMSMASEIYTDTRDINIITEDDIQRNVTLNKPTIDPKSGTVTVENQVEGKKFETYTEVGPSYASMREQAKETLKEMLNSMQPDNPYYEVILAEFISLMDGTTDALSNFNRQQLLRMGLRPPETPEEKQMLAQQQQAAQQPSPQDELMAAATRNEDSQTKENLADAEEKLSQAELNKAKSAEALASAEEKQVGAFETANNVLNFNKTGTAP